MTKKLSYQSRRFKIYESYIVDGPKWFCSHEKFSIEDDARLISAAPDLLKAAKIGLDILEDECMGIYEEDLSERRIKRIKVAITKAEGR